MPAVEGTGAAGLGARSSQQTAHRQQLSATLRMAQECTVFAPVGEQRPIQLHGHQCSLRCGVNAQRVQSGESLRQ